MSYPITNVELGNKFAFSEKSGALVISRFNFLNCLALSVTSFMDKEGLSTFVADISNTV